MSDSLQLSRLRLSLLEFPNKKSKPRRCVRGRIEENGTIFEQKMVNKKVVQRRNERAEERPKDAQYTGLGKYRFRQTRQPSCPWSAWWGKPSRRWTDRHHCDRCGSSTGTRSTSRGFWTGSPGSDAASTGWPRKPVDDDEMTMMTTTMMMMILHGGNESLS